MHLKHFKIIATLFVMLNILIRVINPNTHPILENILLKKITKKSVNALCLETQFTAIVL